MIRFSLASIFVFLSSVYMMLSACSPTRGNPESTSNQKHYSQILAHEVIYSFPSDFSRAHDLLVNYDAENKTFSVIRNGKREGPNDEILQYIEISPYPFVYEEFLGGNGSGDPLQCQVLRFNVINDNLKAHDSYRKAFELVTKISHGSYVLCSDAISRLMLCDVTNPTCSRSVYATDISAEDL